MSVAQRDTVRQRTRKLSVLRLSTLSLIAVSVDKFAQRFSLGALFLGGDLFF